MAQFIEHDTKHEQVGKWARSMWLWHRVEWKLVDSYGIDAASSCDTYVHPPYLDAVPEPFVEAGLVCKKCARL